MPVKPIVTPTSGQPGTLPRQGYCRHKPFISLGITIAHYVVNFEQLVLGRQKEHSVWIDFTRQLKPILSNGHGRFDIHRRKYYGRGAVKKKSVFFTDLWQV